jgi:hypothetical protein
MTGKQRFKEGVTVIKDFIPLRFTENHDFESSTMGGKPGTKGVFAPSFIFSGDIPKNVSCLKSYSNYIFF